jgi:hypothetical protein
MAYALRMSGEMHDWLTELQDSDPAAARQVGEALTALMSEGDRLGSPLVVPVVHPAVGLTLAEALDRSYQRGLEWMQTARLRHADAATVVKRVGLQIADLESQAGTPEQLAGLRQRLAEAKQTERNRTEQVGRRQRQLDAFRTRAEVLKATFITAQAEVAIPDAAGTDASERGADHDDRAAAVDRLRDVEQQIVRELDATPWADGVGDAVPLAGLLELQPGALDDGRIFILFAFEPPGSALLLAVLEGEQALRDHYDGAFALSSGVLRRVRAGQDPEAVARAFGDIASFLDEFFAGAASEIEAGAASLTARIRGQRLAGLRERLGLSLAEVAGRMGVRRERVAAIERAGPGATEVRALASYVEALGGRLEIIADIGGEPVVLH